MPRTPSHKVILLPWLTGVWPQTEVILGSEKLDLVEVSERVFSGNVCNKGQAEFGEGKQSTLCSTGPSIESIASESLGQGALTSPRSQMGSWFPSLLFQYGVSFLCHLLARAPGKQHQTPFLCVVQDYQQMGGGFILGGRCFKLVRGSSQCLTCSQSCPCFCSAWQSCRWGIWPQVSSSGCTAGSPWGNGVPRLSHLMLGRTQISWSLIWELLSGLAMTAHVRAGRSVFTRA